MNGRFLILILFGCVPKGFGDSRNRSAQHQLKSATDVLRMHRYTVETGGRPDRYGYVR